MLYCGQEEIGIAFLQKSVDQAIKIVGTLFQNGKGKNGNTGKNLAKKMSQIVRLDRAVQNTIQQYQSGLTALMDASKLPTYDGCERPIACFLQDTGVKVKIGFIVIYKENCVVHESGPARYLSERIIVLFRGQTFHLVAENGANPWPAPLSARC
jgi:hypothetical protein